MITLKTRFKFLLSALLFSAVTLQAAARDGFAIIVDRQSYNEARSELQAYADAIEQVNGLKVFTIVDKWGVPDSIRATLIRMHRQKEAPIVGAVFVGDIPVPMIRDAQHMTSAFKMNQKADRQESSVPSDRYYDDFGLKFKSLGKDSELNYFYYSLASDSRQYLAPDIYSGRIRPSDVGGTSRYAKLRDFLRKAARVKLQRRSLKQMLFFVGHGYISESKTARLDEKPTYYEHFPQLRGRENRIGFIHYDDANPIKPTMMNELMRPDLDLAMMHHHGAPDTEYYNDTQLPNVIDKAVDFIKKGLRSRLRRAQRRHQNIDSVKQVLSADYGVPVQWMDNALADSLTLADSIADAKADLHLEDFALYNFHPNVPVVIEDACFNGSFHLDDCIADEYIFQPGNTVAVVANTVNSLQDKWSDRLLGLVASGGVVGDLSRFSTYLESHVIGDPTFNFISDDAEDIDHLLLVNDNKTWRKMLKSDKPEYQCLALHQLCDNHAITSHEVASLYEASPYSIVRFMALDQLSRFNDDEFIRVLNLASQDAFELVQREAVILMGRSGDDRVLPALIRIAITNNNSQRVNFDAGTALSQFDQDKALAEFARQFDQPSVVYQDKPAVRKAIYRGIKHQTGRWVEETKQILDASLPAKRRMMYIRQTRNFMVHPLIPELIDGFKGINDPELQTALMESFGWRTHSVYRTKIMDFCKKVSADQSYDATVRSEAEKTYNRLSQQ